MSREPSRERPILFSSPMVRALIAGTKTQTRRVVKGEWIVCPYGGPGDRLWVRESHWWFKDEHDPVTGYYPPKLTAEDVEYRADGERPGRSWRPSIHMPRWASRITLEITGVRVERLQEISEADARAEGAPPGHPSIDRVSREFGFADFPRSWYGQMWEQINGRGSWAANPWVWVLEFRKLERQG